MNTLNSLRGCIEMMEDSESDMNLKDLLENLSEKIIDEIEAQRELTAAENDELKTEWSSIRSLDFLKDLKVICEKISVANNRWIDIDQVSTDIDFFSDRVILTRVLINMIKNALESTLEQGAIQLGCQHQNQEVVFWVHNQAYIPEDVQLQIFQRSFSTKGPNRGHGTYSIRLLTERYLHGRVSFESNHSFGTIFQVFLPLNKNHFNEKEDKNHG
jgi:signal transduction histidine kinase